MSASGLTFVQCINRILSRMREASVTNYNDTDYSTMVGNLLNQVAHEIQEACHWHALRETYSIDTVVGTSQYSLTGSGQNAVVIDGWNYTSKLGLTRGSVRVFDARFFGAPTVQTGSVTEFLVAGLDANFDKVIDVFPVPSAIETLKMTVFVPQDDFAANGTVPLVPQNLLIEETIARLRFERGDENVPGPAQGETFILKEQLAGAVSRDQGSTDDSETDWEVE